MNKFTKVLSLVLALVMVFSLVACGGNDNTTDPNGTTGPTNGSEPSKSGYTVTIKTNGGMAMKAVNVYIYGDAKLTDMKAAGATNEKGQASFELPAGDYYIQLQDLPEGFDVQEYYTFNGTSSNIVLTSTLVKDEDVDGHIFQVGDVMYDFTFEDNSRVICAECGALNDNYIRHEDGTGVTRTECTSCEAALDWENPQFQSISLADVLKDKELVVLNFWYTTCGNCVDEFPILNDAYNMFESVAVLGLNSYALDDLGGAMTFESSYGLDLDFPLGKVSNTFAPGNFINPVTGEGAAGYPTSVFVDRYGVICAIEVGAMTSLTQWVSVFSHFVGDDYTQKTVTSLGELIERTKPTYEMPSVEEIKETVVSGDFTVDFRADEEEYAWPFIITEKDGVSCLKASNQLIYESYAIIYADVYLEAGQVFALDYLASCEKGGDFLHVIVDGEAVYSISALEETWKSAYCWVAEEARTYEIALCYIKDSSMDEGDDTFYIDNMRVVTVEDIDTPSYIPGLGAVEQEDGTFQYVEIVYNENDRYYHVGSEDGPLLLANLMGYTQLFPDNFVYRVALEEGFVLDGVNYIEELTPFCNAANNSSLNGYCTVTYELAELLKKFTAIYGFDGHENEWLKLCKYYKAYGTDGVQLEDPIKGLTWYSALEAVVGEGYVDANGEGQNFFFYDGRLIMPRGMWARFVPEKSGVYRITTTHNDYSGSMSGWVFSRNGEMLYEYDAGEMMHHLYATGNDITMVVYMEAGVDYYIDIAPYIGEAANVGYIIYDLEFLGSTYDYFASCSPGPHTREEGSDQIIIRGIDAALADDGYYHEVLERDENGNPVRFGSIVYAYFDGPTTLFSKSIRDMIDMHGFDFTYSDYDLMIMAYMDMHDGDLDATEAYLRDMWGSEFETKMDEYQVEDVFAGIYHGMAGDLTEEVRAYLDEVIYSTKNPELNGCVAVDARLAEILHMLMDKYVFEDVDDSWQKLCFYYKHMGPQD